MLNLSEQNSPTPRCIPILSNNSDSLETPHSSLRTNQESRISPATPRHCIYPTLFVSNGPSTELQPSNVVNDISHGGGGRLLDVALSSSHLSSLTLKPHSHTQPSQISKPPHKTKQWANYSPKPSAPTTTNSTSYTKTSRTPPTTQQKSAGETS
jgi:hypothetical protein